MYSYWFLVSDPFLLTPDAFGRRIPFAVRLDDPPEI
jgi:hypothetical protein